MKQNMLFSFLILLFVSTGCVQEKANQASISKASKHITDTAPTKSSTGLSAIGSNSGRPSSLVTVSSDKTIVFSGSANGLKVCKYPSGICRTNADEGSGGASAYGDMPGSQNSFIHYMKFSFYSDGYFANNPDGHMAFGLRGKRMRVEEYGDKAGVDGRGIIIGAIGYGYFYNKNNRACVERMAQVESFYRSALNDKKTNYGNKIFPETCSDTVFEDKKWYTVEIEVTSHQYIIYRIYNNTGNLIYKNYIYDQPNYLDPNLTEWFIGHVFETPNTTWNVRLENFEVGHIVSGDSFYPVKEFATPLSFSVGNVILPASKARDYSVVVMKGASTPIKLHNVYGRTRLFGCASYRTSKNSVDSVDCQNPDNYRIMNFSTESDWKFDGNTFSLRETFADSYPSQFYTIYFRLNPQDALTEAALAFELRGPTTSTSGTFCDQNSKTITNWICGTKPTGLSWVAVGNDCYHQATSYKCN